PYQRDREPERGALEQAEPGVLEPIEQLQALDELRGREVEQHQAGDPAGEDPRQDRERHDDGKHGGAGEHAGEDEKALRVVRERLERVHLLGEDRKSTRLNSSHEWISYA